MPRASCCRVLRPLAALRATGLRRLLVACLALAAASCGYDDPGEGSQTVRLKATLACSYPELVTEASFALSISGAPLTNANVVVFDAETHERLEVPATDTPGSYLGTWPGYHRRVQVHVWHQTDGMNFAIEGPSQHTIDTPRPGTVLGRSTPLKVRWRTTDGVRADEVETRVDGSRAVSRRGGDGGKVRFASRELGSGQHTLTVRRSRTLVPAGGAPGSKVTSSYVVATPFVRVENGPHD